jgi:sulfur carrier protein ThiS adenylyltransferase
VEANKNEIENQDKGMTILEQGVLRYLSYQELDKIKSVRIGIAGAGGLGSNCAHFLVRCGFRKFIIVDDDKVDCSNLNRQFYFEDQVGMPKVSMLKENLLRIDPDLEIESVFKKVDKADVAELFKEADVIVEAFDKVECKTMIVETYINSGKLIVAASGMGGWGHPDSIRVKQVKSGFFMVGDFVTAVSETEPPLAPKVIMVAAKQADVVLQMVLGRWTNETCS